MPYCPKCSTLVPEGATFCNACGSPLQPQQPVAHPSPQSTYSPSPQSTQPPWTQPYLPTRRLANLGLISAFLSLFIVPEVFGPVAIVLGAYAWRRERGNLGIRVVIFGIICMLVGLYFTAYFALGDLLLS